jgi:SAM-dependent methyltransferase
VREAARVLRPQGRLLIVDFAPHDFEFLREEHAHLRLGFSAETVEQWMRAASLEMVLHRVVPPEPGTEGKIAVSLWLARDSRVALADAAREVA